MLTSTRSSWRDSTTLEVLQALRLPAFCLCWLCERLLWCVLCGVFTFHQSLRDLEKNLLHWAGHIFCVFRQLHRKDRVCKCDCGCVGRREFSQLLQQQSVLLLEETENKYPLLSWDQQSSKHFLGNVDDGSCHWALQPHLGVARFLGPGFPLACVYSESESHLERTGSQEWLWGEEECRLIGQRCHYKWVNQWH